MRNLFLSVVLIALPVGAFATVESLLPHAAAGTQASAGLGDLGRYQAIVTDVRKIADSGDLAAAAARVTDFETEWDQEEPSLRPIDKAAWGRIDQAADTAFKALRNRQPQAAEVGAALAGLSAALEHGGAGAATAGAVVRVAGIAVTDETRPRNPVRGDAEDAARCGRGGEAGRCHYRRGLRGQGYRTLQCRRRPRRRRVLRPGHRSGEGMTGAKR